MATERNQLYRCAAENCNLVIEVLNPCDACEDALSACKKPMALLEEKTADAATEKHVPVIEKVAGGYRVKVGSVPHPMADDHWIQWIELHCATCETVTRKFLKPGDEPEAFFPCPEPSCDVFAREHCNKHGLWKGAS
jgi:superoxide reductase